MKNGGFKIEKGKPMPMARNAALKYPFAQMTKGDSFYIDLNESVNIGAVRSSACSNGHRLQMKFSVRREGKGLRVFRIA